MTEATIMIVEDQELIATNLKYLLQSQNYTITSIVRSGEEAISQAALDEPDLILMDISLAGNINGIEAARAIKASQDIPIIYLTAEAKPSVPAIMESYGYLRKPFSDAELQAAVTTALHRHRVEQELAGAKQRQLLAYQLGQQLTALLDPAQLLSETLNRLLETFGYYHVHVYLLNEGATDKPILRVEAGTGEAGRKLVQDKHQIPLEAKRSLVAKAARLREPVAVNDVTTAAGHLPNALLPKTRSEVAMPLVLGERLIGVLDVQNTQIDHFNEDEIRTLQIVASQLSAALANAQLFAANVRATERVQTLHRLDQSILAAESAVEIAQEALKHVQNLIPSSWASIITCHLKKHEATLLAQRPHPSHPDETVPLDGFLDIIQRETIDKLFSIERDSIPTDNRFLEHLFQANQAGAYILIPIRVQTKLIGTLNFVFSNLKDFTKEQFDVACEIADVLAVALQQIHQRQSLAKAKERYQSLFDGIPIGLYRLTPSGQILDANPAMVQMLGYPNRAALLAVNMAHTYVSMEEYVHWQEIANEKTVAHNVEARLRRADGTILWAKNNVRAVRDEAGQILYYEGALVR